MIHYLFPYPSAELLYSVTIQGDFLLLLTLLARTTFGREWALASLQTHSNCYLVQSDCQFYSIPLRVGQHPGWRTSRYRWVQDI